MMPSGCSSSFYSFVACGRQKIECKSQKQCIDILLICNGVSDCIDGSDEERCTSSMLSSRIPYLIKSENVILYKCTNVSYFAT